MQLTLNFLIYPFLKNSGVCDISATFEWKIDSGIAPSLLLAIYESQNQKDFISVFWVLASDGKTMDTGQLFCLRTGKAIGFLKFIQRPRYRDLEERLFKAKYFSERQ